MYEKDCVARKNRLCSDLPYFGFANDFLWFCNSLFEVIISQWHEKCLSLMPETCGIKFQFSKFSHLFNLNSAVVTAAVTSVRSNREKMESGSIYLDYIPK